MSSTDRLTARERQGLGLVADGMGTREIAGRLGISPETARKHRDNAVARVGKGSQAAAVADLVRERPTATA